MNHSDIELRNEFSDNSIQLNDSDLLIEAVFGPGGELPTAIDSIASILREAVQTSFDALAGSAAGKVETVATVSEPTKRRLRIFLRAQIGHGQAGNGVEHVSDSPLLKFLARGTLTMLAWIDGSPDFRLPDLQRAIRVLADGTLPMASARPAEPSTAALVKAIAAWGESKQCLREAASARILVRNGIAELGLAKPMPDPTRLLVDRTVINAGHTLVLTVETPDYHGTGEWRVKHGDSVIAATCEAGTLLDKFHRREMDIRPGDALHARGTLETCYGVDNRLLTQRFRIAEVLEILTTAKAPAPVHSPALRTSIAESAKPESDIVEEIEGDFGVLTLRRLPIH